MSEDHNLTNNILTTIKKYNLINENDKIVIGVSGGPDSICLLHILNELKDKLNISIVVAHVNHMIREEADEETEYVKKTCDKLNIDCFVKRINVIEIANNEKIGTEEAGRNVRYEFFEEVLKKTNSNKIATAHNANDNAETVLMNIIRGTSISGLKGIEPIRENKIIRPLIECERIEIENYCSLNHLEPRIDKSNFDNTYTRNKIRNVIIPNLRNEFNPSIIKAINKLSYFAKEEDEFVNNYILDIINNELLIDCDEQIIQDLKLQDYNNCVIIDLKRFNKLTDFIKSKIIIELIRRINGSTQQIEKVNIDEIIRLCSNNIGNKYLVPNKNLKVYVNKRKVAFITDLNA